jgi:dihydrofolate reductase
MRKIFFSMFTTLDGFIEGPNGELDWAIVDEELHTYINKEQSSTDTYLYGRRLYETMAAYWPTADQDPEATDYTLEFARIWNEMPKVVFSKTLEHVNWNSRLVQDDIAGEIARLKAQPGKDMEVGGADLAASFMELGLIDEVQLYIHPVLLGRGKPMFKNRDGIVPLKLVKSHRFSSGVIHLCYLPSTEKGGESV